MKPIDDDIKIFHPSKNSSAGAVLVSAYRPRDRAGAGGRREPREGDASPRALEAAKTAGRGGDRFMTGKEILFALEYVSEEHILRAAPTGKIARRGLVRWAAVSACLCLCIGAALGVMLYRTPAPVGEGITIPQSPVNLEKPTDGMYDMQGLFIYNGRVYRHAQNVDNPSLRGRYLATVTGLIDEWTKADGYVELAGTTPGEIYTVKGYDPDFMLCQTYSGGVSI